LGIAAPALLIATMNGGRIAIPQVSSHASANATSRVLSTFIGSAFAQAASNAGAVTAVKQFAFPKETAAQQIFRGAFGITSKNLWFVICGSHLDAKAAEKQAVELRSKGFSADVYAPYGNTKFFAVVIGANLTYTDAQQLRIKAVNSGLPVDTYLWTFPTQQ
jgi:hypothetical protein